MQFPSKFITNSDFASTPAPLTGGQSIVLTTPASVSVQQLETKVYTQSVTFDDDFDTVDFIITCDEFPDINIYNGYYSEQGGSFLFVSVEISGRTVSLVAVFTAFWSATFTGSRTFRAVVVPMKTPYEQS